LKLTQDSGRVSILEQLL